MPSIYIHIPYCLSKCAYCDFYSMPCKNVPQNYVNAIKQAIINAGLSDVESVYFGGGTPSLLSFEQAQQILSVCNIVPNAEITLEANPETVTLEKMRGFKSIGINRISLGVQTAFDTSLQAIGRVHNAFTAQNALKAINEAGFKNISGDIMLSLPNYSKEEFDATLQLLTDGEVTHISCYMLKIEKNTAFGRCTPKGLQNEDEQAEMYLYAADKLEKCGYYQYEISNFAKKGYESRHNLVYWNCKDYLGVGAAAHSCIGNKRFYYEAAADKFINGAQPVPDGSCTAEDFIMLQLRLNKGLDLNELKSQWRYELSHQQIAFLKQCQRAGYAAICGNSIALTKQGMLLQNSILARLI